MNEDILDIYQTYFLGPRGPLGLPSSVRPPARPCARKIWISCIALEIITGPLPTYQTLSGACLVVSGGVWWCLDYVWWCLVVSDACLVVSGGLDMT